MQGRHHCIMCASLHTKRKKEKNKLHVDTMLGLISTCMLCFLFL